MNVHLLIDNIVRQTTLLIAQLATASGGRAPLAHVAGQVFLDLVKELKAQGLGHKVIADMFGLALRTYHDRVRRLSESATDRGVSLWEAVLSFVRAKKLVTRAELLRRFHRDDEASVRGVLKDLVEGGLVFKSGREDTTTFRAATLDELGSTGGAAPELAVADMVWVVLHQQGPTAVDELCLQLNLPPAELRSALASLVDQRRVRFEENSKRYTADHCIISYDAEHGWEAALFDHFQALVTAMVSKLSRGQNRALPDEAIGGSTYHFDLYRGHPREAEVLGFLASVRQRASELREAVDAARPAAEAVPADSAYRVVFYAGQNVIGGEQGSRDSRNADFGVGDEDE
jgi:hypothetical protein